MSNFLHNHYPPKIEDCGFLIEFTVKSSEVGFLDHVKSFYRDLPFLPLSTFVSMTLEKKLPRDIVLLYPKATKL